MPPEDTTGEFARLPSTVAHPGAANPFQSLVGQTIGNYRVLREIGRGGMGVVYEAEQQNPKRAVALKVINPGVASASALRRFEHEAQILGRLKHPGIATIYEAGTFDLGAGVQPYFAMELIEGETLTHYARRRRFTTRDRLELIARICHAVQHAHQKGIVHRDLKPANILVVEEPSAPGSAGGERTAATGQPKILDFGVARATDRDIQTSSLREDIGQLIGTIPYMSPEQAGGDPNELDTRSDVYAVGVVAYELLVDRLPYDLANRLIHEAVRVIREEEPTRLSSINRTLRGDVEIIIGKALEKEKERRYQSATDFASDIERYLRDEPIVARPPSAAYQLRRFASRNRALVGGVAAVFVVLTAGLIGTTTYAAREAEQRRIAEVNEQRAIENERRAIEEAERAEREAERAEAEAQRALAAQAEEKQRAEELEKVAEFQASQLADIEMERMGIHIRRNIIDKRRGFMEARGMDEDEIEAAMSELDQSLTGVNFTNIALDTLDENIFERALNAIDEQFEDQPVIRARLLQTIAITLRTIGLLDRATAPQTEALEGFRRTLGDEHPNTLISINNMGMLLQSMGRREEALPYYREALESRRRVLGEEHLSTLSSITNMGGLLQSMGRLEEALPYYRQALESSRRVFGEEHQHTLTTIYNMGFLLRSMGRLEEALTHYRQALESRRRVLGEEHPDTLASIGGMGVLLRFMGRPEEAMPYHRQAMESHRRILGEEHPHTLISIGNMGALLRDQEGHLEEAEGYLREAMEGFRRVLGGDHPHTLISIGSLGDMLQAKGDRAEAEGYLREAMEGFRRVLGEEHPHTLTSINNMSHLLRDLGQLEEAERLGAEAVASGRRALGQGHWHVGAFLGHHARTLEQMQRFPEAEERFVEAHAIFEAALGPEHERTIGVIEHLADLYDAWHEAEPAPGNGYDVKAAEWRAKLPVSPDHSDESTTEDEQPEAPDGPDE